jgi:thiamine-monophosphate kinase
LKLVLHGGEDYELLFTARASAKVPARIAGVPVARIGEIVQRRSQAYPMRRIGRDGAHEELKREGWEHFRRGKKS